MDKKERGKEDTERGSKGATESEGKKKAPKIMREGKKIKEERGKKVAPPLHHSWERPYSEEYAKEDTRGMMGRRCGGAGQVWASNENKNE